LEQGANSQKNGEVDSRRRGPGRAEGEGARFGGLRGEHQATWKRMSGLQKGGRNYPNAKRKNIKKKGGGAKADY